MEISPPAAMPPPIYRVDTRPIADAAAIARDPRPDLPLPIPASGSHHAAALTAALHSQGAGASGQRVTEIAPIARTLKPWGIAMLPERDAPLPAPDRAPPQDAARAQGG